MFHNNFTVCFGTDALCIKRLSVLLHRKYFSYNNHSEVPLLLVSEFHISMFSSMLGNRQEVLFRGAYQRD